MDETPSWVKIACGRWGAAKRRIWSGGDWHIDRSGIKQRHVDGYAQSFLGKLVEERYGAGHRQIMNAQFWQEVFCGDALTVQRTLPGMPEAAFAVVHMRYVFSPDLGLTAQDKAALLGVTVRAYWLALARAEMWIWARLDAETTEHNADDAKNAISQAKAQTGTLPPGQKRDTRRIQTSRLGDLCLGALNRPTLHLARRR
jgi:hypothetical protein